MTAVFDLARAAAALGQPIELEGSATAGSSSTTMFVRLGDVAAVLQHPPAAPTLPTAHDLARQHRFLEALAGSSVRVPDVLAFVADPAVAGLPFLVTRRVAGASLLTDRAPPGLDASALADDAIDMMIALHSIDWRAIGLPAPRGSYLARQIERWREQLAATPTRSRLGDLAPAEAWLRAQLPAAEDQTIVHGDYGFHNLLVGARQITSVLDWELATIGDPLADLIGFLKSWPPDPITRNPANDAVSLAPGAPLRGALIERYERATGRRFGDSQRFYEAFALYKAIGVYEGVHARSGGVRFVDEPLVMVARLQALTRH